MRTYNGHPSYRYWNVALFFPARDFPRFSRLGFSLWGLAEDGPGACARARLAQAKAPGRGHPGPPP